MDWNKIIQIEPRLKGLYEKAVNDTRRDEWTLVEYKQAFSRFVGYEADNDLLADSETYDLVYDKFLEVFERV